MLGVQFAGHGRMQIREATVALEAGNDLVFESMIASWLLKVLIAVQVGCFELALPIRKTIVAVVGGQNFLLSG